MNTDNIRELVANGRLNIAIKQTIELIKDTELENLGIGISTKYRRYKRDSIAGIMDSNEDAKRYAVITHQLLDLLNEYELYKIKGLKGDVEKLMTEVEAEAESDEVVRELREIIKEMQQVEMAETKEEVKPGVIQRVRTFLEKVQDPDSSYGKTIKAVKNGYVILQDIAAGYNAVAEWFALPQIPRVFLKKENR